jgi:acyl-coenzyme A synthetase/AMP-(fatty) acid ligase
MIPFYSDSVFGSISYTKLVEDLNFSKSYNRFINHSSYYEIFRDLLVSLLAKDDIIIIDGDLSDSEVNALGFTRDDLAEVVKIQSPEVKDEYDLLERIKDSDGRELTLFTSGTTGKPKKIIHSFQSITKAVRVSDKNSADVWGFAYNPTHIAGIQFFFQALLNLNHLVRLFMLPKDEILSAIEKHSITNISATPTFYRLLLDGKLNFGSVRRITSGGEKFDENLRLPLMKMFPNAKILNVYASTEIGTLFAAEGDVFTVKDHLKHLVKIVEDELYLSGEMTGKSDDIKLEDGWFKTGDKVEIISTEPIKLRFLGRMNESINVGGYKVYPTEVEEHINSIPGVRRSLVYGKKNSVLGNLVMCKIERETDNVTEKIVLDFLQERLQPYKIPRIISFVEQIELTRTGKIARK